MMRHKQLKEGLIKITGSTMSYSNLTLRQTIKIQRLVKKLFGDMNQMDFHDLIRRFPNLGKGVETDDLPF